jgi:23S rRNA (cytosine1962-C5)-methyltransferase
LLLFPYQIVSEYGVKFAVAPRLGHKTGHYLDHRDNRHSLARLCEGKEVLDAFCYSGGFGKTETPTCSLWG